jgi:hypothetical protein
LSPESALFAKNLEYVLAQCCEQSDVSPIHPDDFAERFESLRGYGRLPRGRENRAKHLNAIEIAAAILGLAASNPRWAGHAAVILSNLEPVGGLGASFHEAVNLTAAIERLLTDAGSQKSFLSLALSVAERSINSNGFATLAYQQDKTRRHVAFVSKMAVSLLHPGAENTVDADCFHAPVSRCVVFNRGFFGRVATAIARSVAFPEPPAGDGSEYDAEEAKQARYKALGVQRGSRFLNVGVDTQVTWPRQEMLVRFDEYHLVLMPKTRENTQSVHVDLHANRLTQDQALTIINRFLSMLAWCDDQFAIAQGGWSGNPVPVAVPKRNLAFTTAYDWAFDRRIPQSDEAKRALAIYREGRNAEEAALGSYAVLSYFKIIEIKCPDGDKAKKWIASNFALAVPSADDDPRVKHFLTACGDRTPADYIYDACRLAVAHASIKRPSDADESGEISRLYSASYILRILARRLIANELGISDNIYSGD